MCPFFVYSWQSSLLFLLTGTVIGAAGVRASLLILPVFLLALGLPTGIAVPAAAGLTGLVALSGFWDAWRSSRAHLRSLGYISLPAAAAAAAAAFLGAHIPPSVALWTFVAVAVLASILHLLPRSAHADVPTTRPVPLAASGAVMGTLTGLFGIGWIPPGSRRFPSPAPEFVLLGAVALGAAASMAVHVPAGTFRWTVMAPALIAVFLGMELGRIVLRWLPERSGDRILGAMLAVSATAVVWNLLGR